VSRLFKTLILFSLTAIAPFSWADGCNPSLAALASGSDGELVPLETQLKQMAHLYASALEKKELMPVFQAVLSQLAIRERRSEIELYKEIEWLSESPIERKARREEQEEMRKAEQSRLFEGLRPYLDPIGREHREVIENTLIRPGLVYPLITGEVEFRFSAAHRFLVGDEGTNGRNEGNTKVFSFGPGNDFAIGQVPVTQLLYFLAVLGTKGVDATPSNFKTGEGALDLRLGDRVYSIKPNHPVENVTIADAKIHAGIVSELTGLQYGLPTEFQWEFAN
jgi:hypothetical protein